MLGLVCLGPLAAVYRGSRARSVAVAAAMFGTVFFGLLLYWILLFGWAAWMPLVILQTGWVAVALVASIPMRDKLPSNLRFLAFPTAIVAGEYLRANLPLTGFSWGGLGYTQHDSVAILRVAAFTGVWGISFLGASSAALLAEGLARWKASRWKGLGFVAFAIVLVLAPYAVPVIQPSGESARVATIQGNQPEDPDAPGNEDPAILRNHIELTRKLRNEDLSLVIWPEGAAGSDPFSTPELRRPLRSVVRDVGVPFLVGSRVEVDDEHFRNRSLFIHGNRVVHYDKTRLVPFGEYVPFRRWLVPVFEQLEQVPKDGLPGARLVVFEIPEGRFGSVICFESTFPSLVGRLVKKGAGFVVMITDNGSFARTAASQQHLAFSQLRAAENRIWIAHAALSGISAFVAPDGRVVSKTGLFEKAALVERITFADRATVYTRWGDWFPVLCLAVLSSFVALELVRRAGGLSRALRSRRAGTDGDDS